ncbi:tail protein X [Pseudoalteromonas rubra]|uniref:tail protein X n=1 Tax=Pseudoalteromonas rubra TaxID=43658 RepID=UPI00197F23AF|nr:tail protein X [Pseudoalteromonas rubra]
MKVHSRDGDTVPGILQQVTGRCDDEVEDTLYACNPGLEMHGPILPAGIEIKIPELPEAQPKKAVNLWD